MKIYKYTMTAPSVTFSLPAMAKVFHVHSQGRAPCFWAMVNTDAPLKVRTFVFVGTGDHVPDGEYLGTAHTPDGYV